MLITLHDQVAIITGAASGIGLATVRQFLASGAAGVIAVDLAPEPADFAGLAPRLFFVQGDVATEETARRFTREAMERFGRIDVLINNAAVSVVKPIHEHTPEQWDHVMAVNVRAPFLAARHVIPVMKKQGRGLILNSGSISGLIGIASQGAYAPSKGALHQMTRQMAIEYAPFNIRVNAVCCGTVDTPIVHRSAAASGDPAGYWKGLKDNHPIGRIASAEEIADFFTYLASERASFFMGALLALDGGYTAR